MPYTRYDPQLSYESYTTYEETSYSATTAAGIRTSFQATFTTAVSEAISSKTVSGLGYVSPITSAAPVLFTGAAEPTAFAKIGAVACAGLMAVLAM
jgi:hypothetical protein